MRRRAFTQYVPWDQEAALTNTEKVLKDASAPHCDLKKAVEETTQAIEHNQRVLDGIAKYDAYREQVAAATKYRVEVEQDDDYPTTCDEDDDVSWTQEPPTEPPVEPPAKPEEPPAKQVSSRARKIKTRKMLRKILKAGSAYYTARNLRIKAQKAARLLKPNLTSHVMARVVARFASYREQRTYKKLDQVLHGCAYSLFTPRTQHLVNELLVPKERELLMNCIKLYTKMNIS